MPGSSRCRRWDAPEGGPRARHRFHRAPARPSVCRGWCALEYRNGAAVTRGLGTRRPRTVALAAVQETGSGSVEGTVDGGGTGGGAVGRRSSVVTGGRRCSGGHRRGADTTSTAPWASMLRTGGEHHDRPWRRSSNEPVAPDREGTAAQRGIGYAAHVSRIVVTRRLPEEFADLFDGLDPGCGMGRSRWSRPSCGSPWQTRSAPHDDSRPLGR
jgi:hypothetical protein